MVEDSGIKTIDKTRRDQFMVPLINNRENFKMNYFRK